MEETLNKVLGKLNNEIETTNISSQNYLYMLGIHYNEVIICRLIKAIVEPNGFLGLGDYPIRLFLESVLGKTGNIDIKNPEIILEDKIAEKRRVDIAIFNGNKVYPIEVKIWAKDQDQQLQDYYNYYNSKPEKCDIDKIYYLTPYGHAPSDKSRGNLPNNKIKCLSFGKEIKNYLKTIECTLNNSSKDESKIQVIKNFIEVIDAMCSDNNNTDKILGVFNNLSEKEKNNILTLLKYYDILWDSIRNDYIKNSLKEYFGSDNTYSDEESCEEFSKIDSKCIIAIKYDNVKKAYICIDTNLYIARKKPTDNEPSSLETKWKTYDGTEYEWCYIKKDEKEIWDLKHIDDQLFEHKIDWSLYL